MLITSTGARMMAEAHAGRHRVIADALAYDLEHYPHPPAVVEECRRRIDDHRAEAAVHEAAIAAYDNRFAGELPEQMRRAGA